MNLKLINKLYKKVKGLEKKYNNTIGDGNLSWISDLLNSASAAKEGVCINGDSARPITEKEIFKELEEFKRFWDDDVKRVIKFDRIFKKCYKEIKAMK